MDDKPKTRYPCHWCCKFPEGGYAYSQKLREHTVKHHPDVTLEQLERHIIQTRYPTLDIDYIVGRYKNRLETIIGLNRQGIFIKKYLSTIGVLRNFRSDLALMRFLKPNMKTEEEVKQAMTEQLVGKFRQADAETRFKGYLNRDISVLKKSGAPEELIPFVKVLKTIQFAKKQLQKAEESSETKE